MARFLKSSRIPFIWLHWVKGRQSYHLGGTLPKFLIPLRGGLCLILLHYEMEKHLENKHLGRQNLFLNRSLKKRLYL